MPHGLPSFETSLTHGPRHQGTALSTGTTEKLPVPGSRRPPASAQPPDHPSPGGSGPDFAGNKGTARRGDRRSGHRDVIGSALFGGAHGGASCSALTRIRLLHSGFLNPSEPRTALPRRPRAGLTPGLPRNRCGSGESPRIGAKSAAQADRIISRRPIAADGGEISGGGTPDGRANTHSGRVREDVHHRHWTGGRDCCNRRRYNRLRSSSGHSLNLSGHPQAAQHRRTVGPGGRRQAGRDTVEPGQGQDGEAGGLLGLRGNAELVDPQNPGHGQGFS